MIVSPDVLQDIASLLDGDDSTCVESQSLYGGRGLYEGSITWEKNISSSASVTNNRQTFRVTFNATVNCEERQVIRGDQNRSRKGFDSINRFEPKC